MDDDEFMMEKFQRGPLVNLNKPIEVTGQFTDFNLTRKVLISPNRKCSKQDTISIILCTGCSNGLEAKQLVNIIKLHFIYYNIKHPILKVPLCNHCYDNLQKSLASHQIIKDKFNRQKSDRYCLWCGNKNRKPLRSCNQCIRCCCETCIRFNFSTIEAVNILQQNRWTCFICEETPSFKALVDRYSSIKSLLPSLDKIIDSIRPMKKYKQYEAIKLHDDYLTKEEWNFARVFVVGDVFSDNFKIGSTYLAARDYMGVIFSISRSIRKILKEKVFLIPGFLDSVKLYKHQVESLNSLHEIENSTTEYGNPRGGIFADEPGLGKTATILALICSSVGTLPYYPKHKWDHELIEHFWCQLNLNERKNKISQILKKFEKLQINDFNEIYKEFTTSTELTEIVSGKFRSISFKISTGLLDKIVIYDNEKSELYEILQKGLNDIRMTLLNKRNSKHDKVDNMEKYRASAGTLIIVPHSLLEHWYEQINKFINLQFLSSSKTYDKRGIVYIIGLGDIVDLVPPLSKYEIKDSANYDSFHISTYLIVISTFERCSKEYKIFKQSIITGMPLIFTIRWLRLIVDEGHELLKANHSSLSLNCEINLNRDLLNIPSFLNYKVSDISKDLKDYNPNYLQLFLSQVVAERRWIMTGTPITGSSSKGEATGFHELFKLLCFTNHFESSQAQDWERKFIKPCCTLLDSIAWKRLESLLDQILVRHKKSCLALYNPIIRTEAIDKCFGLKENVFSNLDEDSTSKHRARAYYIMNTMNEANNSFSRSRAKDKRKPKCIVFSQNDDTLQNVGIYQSAELSRFRNSKTKFKSCPLCGCKCDDFYCNNRLYAIRYINLPEQHYQGETAPPPPSPSGHCVDGTGGHYTGICLCSPEGCTTITKSCFSNPFYKDIDNLNEMVDVAIVSSEHIEGNYIGKEYSIGQSLFIKQLAAPNCSSKPPILWQNGILGGEAEVLKFKLCGGAMKWRSWITGNILTNVSTTVEDEAASVLLLNINGSTGLDLSFVTHMFLLENINDNTALLNQLTSRANRIGATGPVLVTIIQVKE